MTEKFVPTPETDRSLDARFPSPIRELKDVKNSEEFLEAVDWRELNRIFDSLAGKSGVARNSEKPTDAWIGVDSVKMYAGHTSNQVLPDNSGTDLKVYNVATTLPSGEIEISWGTADEIATEAGDINPAVLSLNFLIHEMTHRRAHSDTPDAISIDEAITEKISTEVYVEYLERTGNTSLTSIFQDSERFGMSFTYVIDRALLDMLISELALATEIMDTTTVWRSFVAAYMNGESRPKEILEAAASAIDTEPVRAASAYLLGAGSGEQSPEEQERIVMRLMDHRSSVRSHMHKAIHALNPENLRNELGLR